jgi:hypothetical protein
VKRNQGQVIILTILILGGTLLATASIAALLLVYQIRQSTDFQNSGKAIFAADSGVEWTLYNHFNPGASQLFKSDNNKTWKATLNNGALATVTCFQDAQQKNCTDPGVNIIRSVGTSNETSRAFRIDF